MDTSTSFNLDLAHVPHDHALHMHVRGECYPIQRHRPSGLMAANASRRTRCGELTHFVTGVQTHSQHPVSYFVTSRNADGHETLQMFGLHVPRLDYEKHGARLAAATQDDSDDAEASWEDLVCSIIFHHPDILNLNRSKVDPDLDILQVTMDLIRGALNFMDAVNAVRNVYWKDGDKTFPKEMLVDFDGNPVYVPDADGNPTTEQRYRFNYSENLKNALKPFMSKIIREVKDDPRLAGWSWQAKAGQVTVPAERSGKTPATLRATAAAIAPSSKLKFAHVNSQAGLTFDMTTTQTTDRSFEFSITNDFLRYVSIYIQFLRQKVDEHGTAIFEVMPVSGDSYDQSPADTATTYTRDALRFIGLETPKTRFLKMISSTPTLCGIPYASVKESFKIQMPDGADTARILAGGGFGFAYPSDLAMLMEQDDVPISSVMGLVFTGVVNLVIPSIMLAAAAGDAAGNPGKEIEDDKEVLKALASAAKSLISGLNKVGQPGKGAVEVLGDISNMLLGLVTASVKIMTVVARAVAAEQITYQVPMAGQILQAASIISTVAEIAQTTAELIASPLVVENTVSIAIDPTVTVKHDPLDRSGFPATAWVYELVCKYERGMTYTLGDLPVNRGNVDSAPLVNDFADLPGAGRFTVTATFFGKNEDGTINRKNPLGIGRSPQLDASTPDALDVQITIEELKVSLTADTQYSQKRLLTFRDGKHVWNSDAPLPTATIASLSQAERTKALSELVNLNFSQTTGYVGYAWKGSGQNVPLYGSGFPNEDDNFYTFQSINSSSDPQLQLKFSNNGFTGKVLMALEMLPPEVPNAAEIRKNPDPKQPFWQQLGLARPPYNFFLQPNAQADKLFVRQIDYLDGSPGFDLGQDKCFGCFDTSGNMSLDSVAIHPQGYVVAINRTAAKLFINKIPTEAMADAEASPAIPASGKGTRVNLLQDPIAVGCSTEGAILVLDAGAKRIQAFDYRANPLFMFPGDGEPSNYFPLRSYDDGATYLDMAVEHCGFVYVLLYTGRGDRASDYRLDVYEPDGKFLASSTTSRPVPTGKISVDLYRNVYGLAFQSFGGPGGRIEPAVSHLIPSLPKG